MPIGSCLQSEPLESRAPICAVNQAPKKNCSAILPASWALGRLEEEPESSSDFWVGFCAPEPIHSVQVIFHLLKNICYFPLLVSKGSLSLLEMISFFYFSGELKQMEVIEVTTGLLKIPS